MNISELDPKQIGERLRRARDSAKLTQADAAQQVSLARTTLVAIEQGQRRVRIDELQSLARLYGTSANAILRNESVHADFAPRFRKTLEASEGRLDDSIRLLADLARAEVELENLLGIARRQNLPPERPIVAGDVRQQAESDAADVRLRLGLGLSPVRDMVTLLELELGVRVFVRPLDGKVSGLFAYDDSVGACVLLNANHPLSRRTQTAAHELGHIVATRREPEMLLLGAAAASREERYADAFARAFLTPGRLVSLKFQEVTAGSSQLTRRHIIVLAHYFGVSREAMTRRLEELGLCKSGTWAWFERNGGITDEQERQVLGDLAPSDPERSNAAKPTTLRIATLAQEAHRREILSEGQLARLLKLDRVALREMLDESDGEGGVSDV